MFPTEQKSILGFFLASDMHQEELTFLNFTFKCEGREFQESDTQILQDLFLWLVTRDRCLNYQSIIRERNLKCRHFSTCEWVGKGEVIECKSLNDLLFHQCEHSSMLHESIKGKWILPPIPTWCFSAYKTKDNKKLD